MGDLCTMRLLNSKAEKFKLSFDIYDVDQTGRISKDEMTKAGVRTRSHTADATDD